MPGVCLYLARAQCRFDLASSFCRLRARGSDSSRRHTQTHPQKSTQTHSFDCSEVCARHYLSRELSGCVLDVVGVVFGASELTNRLMNARTFVTSDQADERAATTRKRCR